MAAALMRGWHSPGGSIAPADAPPAALSPRPTTIVPGVHLLGGLDPAAAYVIETSAGLVLVDSGMEPDARALKEEMSQLGLDWRSLHAILLTHVHADHSGGAQYLRSKTGAKVYAGEGDAAILRGGSPREAFYGTFMLRATGHATAVDVALKGDEIVELGEARFRVLRTPGHTPGSLCYLMERNKLRVLFAGDVIMSLPAPYSGPPLGTYAAYRAPRYGGDARAFLTSLQNLCRLPAPDLVLPGHPRYSAIPQSPAMSAARWREMLNQGAREMEALLARYERYGAHFLEGIPSRLLPGLYYFGDFKGTAVYGLVTSAGFFVVADSIGPGLFDLISASQKKLDIATAVPTALVLTSYRPEEMAGLKDVLARTPVSIVAGGAALTSLRKACPADTVVLSAQDLPQRRWFNVAPIPLFGAAAPVAYQVSWADNVVVFSGRIPVPVFNQPALEQTALLLRSEAEVLNFRRSLRRLSELEPDIWLPALPLIGQNAKLYAVEWQEIISENEKRVLELAPGRNGAK